MKLVLGGGVKTVETALFLDKVIWLLLLMVLIVRRELTKFTDVYDGQKAVVERYYVGFMKDTQHIRNYLQEEDNR